MLGCSDDDITSVPQQPIVEEDSLLAEWDIVFEEEFDSDLSKWDIWESGAYNEEIQLYREEQLSLENGILTINIRREDATGATNPYDLANKQFEYVSARIESKELFSASDTEGENEYRFSARIKLPAGNGMWPAFWTYGDPWPTQGEIDILEARGGDPDEFQTNLFFGTEPNVNINFGNEVKHTPGPDLTADFHIYGMVWKSDSIDILFDEKLIYSYATDAGNNIESMFGKEQKIVLNTAVGGLFFPDRNPANYADSASMQVDWVRVYSK